MSIPRALQQTITVKQIAKPNVPQTPDAGKRIIVDNRVFELSEEEFKELWGATGKQVLHPRWFSVVLKWRDLTDSVLDDFTQFRLNLYRSDAATRAQIRHDFFFSPFVVMRWKETTQKLCKFVKTMWILRMTRDNIAAGKWRLNSKPELQQTLESFCKQVDYNQLNQNLKNWKTFCKKMRQLSMMSVKLRKMWSSIKAGTYMHATHRKKTRAASLLQAYLRKMLDRKFVVDLGMKWRRKKRDAAIKLQACVRCIRDQCYLSVLSKYCKTGQKLWSLAVRMLHKSRLFREQERRAYDMARRLIEEEEKREAEMEKKKTTAKNKRQRRKENKRKIFTFSSSPAKVFSDDFKKDVHEEDYDFECRLCMEAATVETQGCKHLILCQSCRSIWENKWLQAGLEAGTVQCLTCEAYTQLDNMFENWVVV